MKKIALILLGNTIYALGVVLFIVPNGLVTGGTTGLALIGQHYFNLPISSFVTVFNVLMFLVGWWVLGKTFALTTLLSTFYYPMVLTFFERTLTYRTLTDDLLLAAILGGLMIGVAIGLVIENNASTGGMDIPPLILKKKLGISVSVSMYAFDFMILIGQMFYSEIETILYGIVLVLMYTVVLDRFLMIGQSRIQALIVSSAYENIRTKIIHQLDRTVTMLDAKTGYKHYPYPVILCVLSKREVPKLNALVQECDEHAFMVISAVNEVSGRGFTFKKEYLEGSEDMYENHPVTD